MAIRTACRWSLLAPLLAGVALAVPPPNASMTLPDNPEVVLTMSAAAPVMNRAIHRARNGAADFLKFARSPKDYQQDFAVRVVLYWGNQREYIWIRDFRQGVDTGLFTGKVADRIYMQTGFKPGDRFTFVRGDIIDWRYTDTRTGRIRGAYTECALMTLAPTNIAATYRKERKPDCDL